MQKYKIILTRRAKDDLIDIGDYITYTLLEPETSQIFIRGLRKTIMTLKEIPKRHAFVDDPVAESQHIRCLPYKNHYIFYQVIDVMNTVIVLRIGYNRRNWKDILIK